MNGQDRFFKQTIDISQKRRPEFKVKVSLHRMRSNAK